LEYTLELSTQFLIYKFIPSTTYPAAVVLVLSIENGRAGGGYKFAVIVDYPL
jgi:hypothetical protein